MATVRDVAAYLCKHSPGGLSKARLTKLVYLADWKAVVERGRPVTDIAWFFNNYGPYVPAVVDAAKRDSAFKVEAKDTVYGNSMDLISLKHPDVVACESVNAEDIRILDEVLAVTKDLNFTEFIEFVYGTYPIVSQQRYTQLDLVRLAHDYRAMLGVSEVSAP
jgi:uncharacterized phage-associated protein